MTKPTYEPGTPLSPTEYERVVASGIHPELTPDGEDHTCPECAAGKHSNCDGTGWSNALDKRVPCACTRTEHHAQAPEGGN
jgi:hypothetical protein